MSVPLRYRSFRLMIRLVLRLYYREIESYGTEFIPKRGRTLFIANHQAGLVDGILVLGSLDQIIRTVIKHTLWKEPIVGFFATGLGMIPVYRKQDLTPAELTGTTSKDRNQKSFSAVEKAFLNDESCLIFPEGISHDKPQLQEIKSGPARMLLETEAAHDFRLGLQWLPTAIDLEVKDQPGHRALVHYHPPRGVAHHRERFEKDPEGAIKALRDEMQAYLAEITLNFDSWENRVFLERLTEIWLCQAPNELLLDRHNQLLKWKRILETTSQHPEEIREWAELRAKVRELSASLESLGVSAGEVSVRQIDGRKRLLAELSLKMTVWAPLFFFGVSYWYFPLRTVKFLADKLAKNHRDVTATYHIVGSLVVFPLWVIATMLLAYLALGEIAMFGLGILAVASGLSLLTSARRLRVEFRELINMYRYRGIASFLDGKQREIFEIWKSAARIWNNALRRQIRF